MEPALVIGFAAATAALKPYLVWVKAAAVAAVFAGGVLTGCQFQKGRDAEKIGDLRASLVKASAELRGAGNALREVTNRTRAEKAAADANTAANTAIAKDAERKAKEYRDEIEILERDLARAKARSPSCRAQLEQPLCTELR